MNEDLQVLESHDASSKFFFEKRFEYISLTTKSKEKSLENL